ncbi:mandelate racemase/muconate lactonizing enzyme family protein [Aestuariimicrobium ganziense]|uniref:mandelate racemase/muconate lactonizing enzyme family protein n=1 Tax=Aestuariimicrobium ganziense TaxID=2773677 RepID=UPI00194229E6|nr:mandelate racemase/muconate lactonizing enzyme family protein [Aestuariimicrobium ganziense]
MEITGLSCSGLRGATPAGGWAEELTADDSVHTLVAVHTDTHVGLGSVFTSAALVRGAFEVLRPFLVGQPVEPERLTETLHRNTFWMGRGGSITRAISGIDQALWDLFGKLTGQPVHRLLGGTYRRRVRPYASLLMDADLRFCDDLRALEEAGFRSFKIGWGPFGRESRHLDEAMVTAARGAISDDSELMIDAGASDSAWRQDYRWALQTAHMLADHDITWFEEALRPDLIDDFVLLREHSPVPISGGEVLTRRQSFEPWIQRGALDILQPDVTKCGGISEIRHIAWRAHDRGLKVIPHGWNTAVGLAADLQLAAALPDTDRIEYIAGSAYVDDLVAGGWTMTDGHLDIPDEPGLGIVLDPDAVTRLGDNPDFLTRPERTN